MYYRITYKQTDIYDCLFEGVCNSKIVTQHLNAHNFFLFKIENKRHLLKIEVNKPLQILQVFHIVTKKILHTCLEIKNSNVQ